MLIPLHMQAVPAGAAAPDPGWLTQPVATVIAAGVALLVACVTLVGIGLNHRQHREKERIAAIERRRSEAVEALVEALEAATTAFGLVAETVDELNGFPVVVRPGSEYELEVDAALDRCRVMRAKVHLLGLDDDGAMGALTKMLGGAWSDILLHRRPPRDFDQAWRARDQLLDSFRGTVDRHRNLYDPPVMLAG